MSEFNEIYLRRILKFFSVCREIFVEISNRNL